MALTSGTTSRRSSWECWEPLLPKPLDEEEDDTRFRDRAPIRGTMRLDTLTSAQEAETLWTEVDSERKELVTVSTDANVSSTDCRPSTISVYVVRRRVHGSMVSRMSPSMPQMSARWPSGRLMNSQSDMGEPRPSSRHKKRRKRKSYLF